MDNARPSCREIPRAFVRDRLTWCCYLIVGSYIYTLAALGPLMPFLRSELNLNCTIAAYHFSAWALGSLIAGTIGDRIAGTLGRSRAIMTSGTLYLLAMIVIVSAHAALFTISGALVGGFFASIVGQTVMASLADRMGELRAIAITELNITCSICAALAPASVSMFVKCGLGWRAALYVSITVFLSILLIGRSQFRALPPHKAKEIGTGALPTAYWFYWIVILLMVACEWSMIFWSAEFFERVCKCARVDASQMVGSFLFAMLFGRLVGSRLVHHYKPSVMLPVASIIAIAGFVMYWLGQNPVLSVIGLFITGLGISNFYPFTVSAALAVAPNNSSGATARISMATGSAVLYAPLILGMVADRCGIFTAYGIIGALLIVAAAVVQLANRAGARHVQQTAL